MILALPTSAIGISAIGNQAIGYAPASAAAIPAAVAKLAAKTPIGSPLRTADWERVPAALRERAQFSAAVEDARILQTIQTKLLSTVAVQREALASGKAAYVDRSSFIGDLREQVLGSARIPTTAQDLRELASRARLGLIYDQQIQSAQNYATWKLDQTMLADFPAQELSQSSPARRPRLDWPQRFADTAAAVDPDALAVFARTGRMAALKTSRVWETRPLSRFQVPWPPFDFGSQRELRDIDREEALALGLLSPSDQPDQSDRSDLSFNSRLEASAQDLSPEFLAALQRIFGAAIQVAGNLIRWSA